MNTIQIFENGPLYFHGNVEVQDPEGNILLTKEKVALCRCGGSANKPVCDGTHKNIEFKGDAAADTSGLPAATEEKSGKLILKSMENGPILVEGNYTIESGKNGSHTSEKKIALCRCGGSSNKPFCDGTHKEIGFKSN
ncbi:MAG: CDGSH iron-sulfur domain-containing protein [Balneolaceae bacterium]